jgi:hypothetical protein
MNFLQCPDDNLTPTLTQATNLEMTPSLSSPTRVSILRQTLRDHPGPTMDTCNMCHQPGADEQELHQHVVDAYPSHQSGADAKINYQSSADGRSYLHDRNYRDKSAITGMLCKRVLAYVKWHQGCYPGVDTSMMDSLGCWLHNRGIGVYIDPV